MEAVPRNFTCISCVPMENLYSSSYSQKSKTYIGKKMVKIGLVVSEPIHYIPINTQIFHLYNNTVNNSIYLVLDV